MEREGRDLSTSQTAVGETLIDNSLKFGRSMSDCAIPRAAFNNWRQSARWRLVRSRPWYSLVLHVFVKLTVIEEVL